LDQKCTKKFKKVPSWTQNPCRTLDISTTQLSPSNIAVTQCGHWTKAIRKWKAFINVSTFYYTIIVASYSSYQGKGIYIPAPSSTPPAPLSQEKKKIKKITPDAGWDS